MKACSGTYCVYFGEKAGPGATASIQTEGQQVVGHYKQMTVLVISLLKH